MFLGFVDSKNSFGNEFVFNYLCVNHSMSMEDSLVYHATG